MAQRQIKKQIHGQAHNVRVDSGPGWRAQLEEELNEVLQSPLQAYKFVPEVRGDEEGIEVRNLDFRQLLELPLRLLTASEILWRIDGKHVGSFGEYEDFIDSIHWPLYFPNGSAIKVRSQSYRSTLYHEGKLDKIACAVLDKKSYRTSPKDGDYSVRIEQRENRCTAYLAFTVDPLFRRKYKVDYSHPAPLQEHLAAAAIRWVLAKESVDCIYVPFAGSGTMLMETWLYVHKPPLDLWRPLKALEKMPDFPEATWKFLKNKLSAPIGPVLSARAIEWDKKGVEVLRNNLAHAEKIWLPLKGMWSIVDQDFLQDRASPDARSIFLPLNPPYGLRLEEDTAELYLKLGQWLHKAFLPHQRRFGFVLLADSRAFHAFEKGVGVQCMNGIQSFTQGGQHIRCVSFDIPAVT